MKKIALILAVIMLFSAVSVFAAPVADYVFYNDKTGSYFVYGRYANSTLNKRNLNATEAGIYVNGEKFVYGGPDAYVTEEGEDGTVRTSFLEIANGMEVPKFGIELKGPKDYFDTFKVQPYIVNKTGEIKGDVINYDPVTGERILSDNADLKYINVEMTEKDKKSFLMYPSFDPDTLDYTVEGYFTAAAPLTDSTLTYALADSRAQEPIISHSNKTTYIKVIAEDGSSTKTYSVTYKKGSTMDPALDDTTSIPVTTVASAYYQGPTAANTGVVSINGNGQLDMQYWPASGEQRILLMTFNINDVMKTKEHFAVTFIPYMNTDVNFSDYIISAKTLTVANGYTLEAGKTCYNDITKGSLTIGEEVGTITVKSFTYKDFQRYSVDVTKAVKDAIAAEQSYVGIALSIDSCTVPAGDHSNNNVNFRTYFTYKSAKQYNLNLVY